MAHQSWSTAARIGPPASKQRPAAIDRAVIRLGTTATRALCGIGLVPSVAVLALITFDIIGLVGSDRAPLLPASAVTPVALVAFAWAVVCALAALVAARHAGELDEARDMPSADPPFTAPDPSPSASERHD